jgi:hypothetical protein
MQADFDMNSNDIINVDKLYLSGLYIDGQPVAPGTLNYNGVIKETQTATSGQTVFNLATMVYNPGINSLSVYVDGVYQNPSTYTENNSTRITFSAGLHVGAIVDFVALSINEITGGADATTITYTPSAQSLYGTSVITAKSALDQISNEGTGSSKVGFLQSGTGATNRTVQDKLREYVSVKDFGADPTGATDSRQAFQNALNAVLASGNRGTVYVPSGTYLINGVTSSDSILNGILFPWDTNYDIRPYVRFVGDNGATIKAGSNNMVVFRVSTTFVEISNLCIDGNGKTDVTGIGVWPENTGNVTLTTPASQSYFLSHSVTLKNLYVGMAFQPGVTDTTNRQSGCFFHSVYNCHGNTNTQHLVFSYPYDYDNAPSATNQNYITRSGFHNCHFVNGNVGIYAKGVGDVYFFNTSLELINSTSNTRGTAPLATPTGLYVSSQGTFAKVVQMYGGYIEACTETIYNGRTNGVQTVGTGYLAPTTGNYRNIVNLNKDGFTLANSIADAAITFTPTADSGLDIMADPANAKAATIVRLGIDSVYNMAIQPYLKVSGTSAVTTSGLYHAFYSDDTNNAAIRDFHTGASGVLRGHRYTFPNASPNDTTSWFQFADDATESKFIVWSNGTCQNRTGTFSAISDEKLKQDITPAPSYWDKFKSYEFVNFAFKNDPEQRMLGVVAQQIEKVSPGLVYETPDYEKVLETDENGNDIEVERPTGTTTKAVKQSIMSVISQVVLQEALLRIETLEAKLAAMEGKKA